MSSSTNVLVKVSQQMLKYGGLVTIFIGLLGSLGILLVFNRQRFNRSASSTYIKTNAILSIFHLAFFYLTVIITRGFEYDLIALNNGFCKFLTGYGITSIFSVLTINWFILFDRFAISSRSARFRSLSSKKIARTLVLIALIITWCSLGIPAVVLYEKLPIKSIRKYICSTKSKAFALFGAFFLFPIVEGVFPIVLTVLFWWLTRRQVGNFNNETTIRRFDKQLTRMYLFQMLLNTIASVPYASINLYRAVTFQIVHSRNIENIVTFFHQIAICLFYLQYCTDFYLYLLISKDIRSEVLRLFHIYHRFVFPRRAALRTIYKTNTENQETSMATARIQNI